MEERRLTEEMLRQQERDEMEAQQRLRSQEAAG